MIVRQSRSIRGGWSTDGLPFSDARGRARVGEEAIWSVMWLCERLICASERGSSLLMESHSYMLLLLADVADVLLFTHVPDTAAEPFSSADATVAAVR